MSDSVGFWVRLSIFMAVYCSQPMLVDYMKLLGAANPSTFLYMVPHYLAMIPIGFLPAEKKWSECKWKGAIIVSVTDIAHQLAEKVGLVYGGSAMYSVVSSSAIVWTAVAAKWVLGKTFSWTQWAGMYLIVMGLSLLSVNTEFSLQNEEFIGVIFVVASGILHAMTFVLYEKYMTDEEDKVPGTILTGMMGIISSVALVVWSCVWTLPRLNELFIDPVNARGGQWGNVIQVFSLLFATSIARAAVLWWLLEKLGAVSSGLVKGGRVILVVAFSHMFFCSADQKFCLTWTKFLSALFCMLGVGVYTIASRKVRAEKEKLEDDSSSENGERNPLVSAIEKDNKERGDLESGGSGSSLPSALVSRQSTVSSTNLDKSHQQQQQYGGTTQASQSGQAAGTQPQKSELTWAAYKADLNRKIQIQAEGESETERAAPGSFTNTSPIPPIPSQAPHNEPRRLP
uniref:EamA domain-containing protein n=1 Tax=Chromera velia CCMP2878 TaxID=1169474 RepID=A0A0G4HI37_9ALVE|eukprot:Cvel_1048.t1-p1 / transcript=Cvel_1048.t1 / gene=Cvel_1048 / organism=Chromera_velia_CCMP2878 / gene_product=hypothetical protein / transcript_product=hypothetical protein / location=Cvel_scaffold34:40511-46691(+) / protein_length=455 / sequence_SO=supercontig / SO=protein_coding / is_pseudo=false